MRSMPLPMIALLVLTGSAAARADGFDEGQARSRMEAAGYADVIEVHEGNLGEWMAQAEQGGDRHVMIVFHPDGRIALRGQIEAAPVTDPEPLAPAKP